LGLQAVARAAASASTKTVDEYFLMGADLSWVLE
jgi:hypothetical protein